MSGWKYAFSLSKDQVQNATPPGTITLVHGGISDNEAGSQSAGNVVKLPRPSGDPADPLNLPQWRKIALLIVASLYAFVANWTSSTVAPALATWSETFPADPRPYKDLTYLVAVNVLMLGASNIVHVPLSNIFGRRPVLIVATLLMTLCSMWGGLSKSYNSLLAARVIQGIGGGASEAISPAQIGDVFFVHERGRAMAFYTVFLATGSIVGGISGGYIAYQIGWAYIFWISTALSAACFVGTVLFVPETLYQRSEPRPTAGEDFVVHGKPYTTHTEEEASAEYKPYTFVRSLGFARPKSGLVRAFVQPWRTLALPGTWVVMLHYASLVGGTVTISTIGSQITAQPPYSWGANAGLINIGPLVGCFFGGVYTYLVSDAQLKSRAKHEKHGFSEPEDRLPTMFIALLIATGGFFVFGFCAQYPGPNVWVGLEFGFGMIAFGLMQVPSIGFSYLIDSYSFLAGDCFVIVTILRSVIAFAWTFFVAEWVQTRGPAEPFGIFGMLMGLFALLTIPLWLFGKQMRIATAGHVKLQ